MIPQEVRLITRRAFAKIDLSNNNLVKRDYLCSKLLYRFRLYGDVASNSWEE